VRVLHQDFGGYAFPIVKERKLELKGEKGMKNTPFHVILMQQSIASIPNLP